MSSIFKSGMTSHITYTNSIDSSLTLLAELFELTMELEQQSESIRMELSENTRFYPEQVFASLKNYQSFQRLNKVTSEKSYNNFFQFENQSNRQVEQNLMNSAKDGLIEFGNVAACLKSQLNFECERTDIGMIEKLYHTYQSTTNANQFQGVDAQQDRYPLPADFQQQTLQQQQTHAMTQKPQQFIITEQKLNSGDGINYNTFLRMVLSQAIPAARNKALKRKLIYESELEKLVDKNVLHQVAQLFRIEVLILKKCEILRVKLAQEPGYNLRTLFTALDTKRDNEIDYETLELYMQCTQHNLKPKGFSALVRRARILGGRSPYSGASVLSFEDFVQLVQVRNPYYKKPIVHSPDAGNQTVMISGIKNDKYQVHRTVGMGSNISQNHSRLLDTHFEPSQCNHINSKLRSINVDDATPQRKQQQTSNQQSKINNNTFTPQPNVPLYHSTNRDVSKLIKNQVQSPTLGNQGQDFIVYGTRREYENGQQNSGQQQSIQRSQQQEEPLVRPSTNFDHGRPQSLSNTVLKDPNRELHANQVVGEANYNMKFQQRQNQTSTTREVLNAQHANTRFMNVVPITQAPMGQGGLFAGAPWKQVDRQSEQNIKLLNNEMNDIKRMAGLNNPVPPSRPPTNHPADSTPVRPNRVSARHQIFGDVSAVQSPFLYTDLHENGILNHHFDGKYQIQPRPDHLKA